MRTDAVGSSATQMLSIDSLDMECNDDSLPGFAQSKIYCCICSSNMSCLNLLPICIQETEQP